MSDVVYVFLICVFVLAALVFVPIWIGKAIRRGAREMPAPPVEPTDPPRHACVVVAGRRSHEYRPIRDGAGIEWFVCGLCGETVRRSA